MKNIFGKFNIVDIIIVLGVIIALIIGIATTKHFRQTADKQIEATSPITFQVFLRGSDLTSTTESSVYGTFLIVIKVLSPDFTGNSCPVTVTPRKNT